MNAERIEERKAIKNNFLDKIIIRYDYDGVTDYDLGKLSKQFRKFCEKNNFPPFHNGKQKEFEVQIKKSINLDPENIIQRQIGEHDIYVFEKENIKLAVTNSFTYVLVERGKYIPFDVYNGYISDILKILNNELKISLKRFGIRKSNIIYLRDIVRIFDYFSEDFFPIMKERSFLKIFNIQESIKFDKPNSDFNYQRLVNQCFLKDEIIYQIKLDMDIYMQAYSGNINTILGNQKLIEDLNTKLFEVYKKTLNPCFFEELKRESLKDDNVIGISKNDGSR